MGLVQRIFFNFMILRLFKENDDIYCCQKNNSNKVKLDKLCFDLSLSSPLKIKNVFGTYKPIFDIEFEPINYERDRINNLIYFFDSIYE